MQETQQTDLPRLFVRIAEAARILDFSRAKAYAMAASGELPGVVRIGRSLRVSIAELEKWAKSEACRQTANRNKKEHLR